MTQTAFPSPATHPPVGHFPRAVVSVSRAELDSVELTVKTGLTDHTVELPPHLQGYVFIIGPAGTLDACSDPNDSSRILPSQDGFTPLYNGDGMIYRIKFEQGKAFLTTKIAETTSFLADEITHNNPQYPALEFANYGITRASFNLGLSTQLSVTLTPFRFDPEQPYRLLVGVDIGRPYEIDPQTLAVLQPIGSNQFWKSVNPLFPDLAFPMVMCSGHPSFDFERKELYTVNLGKSITSFLPRVRRLMGHFPGLNRLLHPSHLMTTSSQRNGASKTAHPLTYLNIETLVQRIHKAIAHAMALLLRWSHRHFPTIDRLLGFISRLWNGLEQNDFTDLIRWNADGFLERWRVVLDNGEPVKIQQTLHQMWATRNYIVLADTAFKIALEELLPYERSKLTVETEKFLRDLTNVPQLAETPLYIIARDRLISGQPTVVAQAIHIPRETAHYIVEYEDRDGIVLHTVHGCATDAAETIRGFDTSPYGQKATERMRALSGMLVDGMDQDWIASYVIHPEATEPVKSYLLQQDYCWGEPVYAYRHMTLEQPHQLDDLYWIFYGGWQELMSQATVDLYRDYPHRTLSVEETLEANRRGQAATLCRVHVDRHCSEGKGLTLQLTTPDVYHFPPGYFANSPQFVPIPGQTEGTAGYLTCVVHYDDSQEVPHSEIWIFDAQHLHNGPQYRLCSDRMKIGFTIHTTWLPEVVSPTGVSYNIREDYEPLVSRVVQEHAQSWFPSQRHVGQQIRALFDEIYCRCGQ